MKSEKRMMLKLRGGTAPFRWRWEDGGERNEKRSRTCKECNSGEVEDVVHWLLRCRTSMEQPAGIIAEDDPTRPG